MKSYYYVNVSHIVDNLIERDGLYISLEGRHFKSVKVHSALFVSTNEYDGLVLRLDSFTGNGFSTNRRGVAMCLFDSVSVTNSKYHYSINNPSPTYFISETLNELNVFYLNRK